MTTAAVDLTGRVAIVTGAARGLGRAHALTLARRGARVVAVDVLDASEVVEAIERERGVAASATLDLARPDGCDAALAVALDAYGAVDVVVNNAGLVRDRMSFNLSDEDWRLAIEVNLSASFYLARAAVRHWRACGPGGDEVIINTSSESGLYGNAGQANYAAAKAGVAALTLTLASELARYGIRVNAIAPRARTPMSADAFGDLPRSTSFDPFGPEHVSEVVAWLASDAAHDVTGQVIVVHGGGVEVMLPWSVCRRVTRRGPWSEEELDGLRDELFPDGRTRRIAAPVGDLFRALADDKESVGHA